MYRDALVLVLNKPAGIPVHKGRGSIQPLDTLFHYLKFGLPHTPELAHRLDKDTSGCLVLGRNAHALQSLGALFAQNKINKTYIAWVHNHPPHDEGIVDVPLIKKSTKSYEWHMKTDHRGQPAITHYRIIETYKDKTLLELKPKTGRTHQLRVHCAHMNCPIIGDKIYGIADNSERMYLHASEIILPIYKNKRVMVQSDHRFNLEI